jgi:hypothetical protein
VANYQRLSWQVPGAKLRLTLDLDLSFFASRADLWQRERVLVRELLGEEVGRTPGGVLELKHRGELPAWLQGALGKADLQPTQHSKFALAATAVHGA